MADELAVDRTMLAFLRAHLAEVNDMREQCDQARREVWSERHAKEAALDAADRWMASARIRKDKLAKAEEKVGKLQKVVESLQIELQNARAAATARAHAAPTNVAESADGEAQR